ncbi:hypothetical protein Cpap_2355 [Ruminiclostridium papyrosolvens DSM 2782]|uniref:SLH domain-containing protein n=1 Tax=Ruminiclostridium papyrosolvens DSM 2782 TaxID=588581 RepID=F1TB01_9FIRM|nr:hypothetical protein [Ruminiclostridium papyrosolvens]EGD48205.1 hypothetical protein Cpap_2355 [Ruminiclostridium papyrosolvens DSM 2782]WES34285.1 hypothetical protein P0092_21430 [Ruminiclostridium papyrosolvens DSM 2782]
MRNLRKLTAVVIAVALVLTSMTAAFAASGSYEFEDQATVLKDLGIWQGNTAGDLMLGEKLTRAQGAVLVLKTVLGKTDKDMEAADVSAIAKFDDAAEVPAWAEGWVALAVKEGVMKGGNNKLAAGDELKGKDLASMFMNALGFAAENEYATAVEKLAAKSAGKILAGIADDITDADLTRDAASAVVFDTLTVKAKDATKTVVDVLVGTDAAKKAVAVKAGLIAAPTTLDIAKVEALNLRELVVTFNGPVTNVDAAKKTANYKIGTSEPEAVTLSDDKTTVTLRTASANAMGNYATDIELTVLKAVGFAADKTIKGISVKDTTVPYAKSVSTTGPKNIKVTLSEPLRTHAGSGFTALIGSDIASSVKIDGAFIAIDSTATGTNGLELNIKTYSDLGEGSHKIEFIGSGSKLFDNAGYQIQGATLTFDYVKDTSALALTYVESTETSVTVKFNKAIKTGAFSGNANVAITHTYNSDTNKVLASTAGTVTTTDDQTFKIDFTNARPFPPGATTVYINYVSDSGTKIEDNYGNKLAATSFAVSTAADLTKPTATAEFVDAKTVKVTFSEDVQSDGLANAANNVGNYVLKNGNDVVSVATAAFDVDSKKVIKLTTTDEKALNGTSYTLTVKNVKDVSVAKNQIDEVTLSFTGTDKVPPEIKSAKLVSDLKYKITFTEAMDLASITDKTVYRIGATSAASTTLNTDAYTIDAVDGNKAVVITFKTAPSATDNIYVARVKDAAGNWSEFFSAEKVIGTKTTVALAEYQITGKNAIKLKFEDVLKNMEVNDFLYSTDGGTTFTDKPNSLSVSIADGVTYITLVTKDITSAVGANVDVKTNGITKAQNEYGSTVDFNTTTKDGDGKKLISIVDKRAPSKVADMAFTDIDDNKGTKKALKTVTITYDEDIYAASVQESDYTVAGYEIDSVQVNPADKAQVIITLKTLDYGSYTLGTDIVKVKQVGEIQDLAKNTLGAQDEWSNK